MQYSVKDLREQNMIIFETITGSRAYGTSLPTSDTDIRGVFIQPLQDVLRTGRFVEQVSDDTNDTTFYEFGRFIELVKKNNPNIIELLNPPEDMVQNCHHLYGSQIMRNHKNFLTSACKFTFGGYAIQQIKKANGYDKKMHWEESQMVRKDVLDFCYVIEGGKSVELKKWMKETGSSQEQFGLAKVDHGRDIYAMYHHPKILQRWGIVSQRENPNDVQTVSIPKVMQPLRNMIFNKDAYSTHCKRYNEYQEWLKNRNEDRYKMNKAHGKNYDSKNMMHTFRILLMATEIAETQDIKVRRSPEEIEKLMKIRRGEYDLDLLLEEAEELKVKMDLAYDNSNLPQKINPGYLDDIQELVRNNFYKDTNQL